MSTIGAIAVVAGSVAVPTIALGNARRTEGTLSATHAAEQPYVALLSGSNEVPDAGDPDGSGGATVTIDILDDVDAELCWDVSYGAIDVAGRRGRSISVSGIRRRCVSWSLPNRRSGSPSDRDGAPGSTRARRR